MIKTTLKSILIDFYTNYSNLNIKQPQVKIVLFICISFSYSTMFAQSDDCAAAPDLTSTINLGPCTIVTSGTSLGATQSITDCNGNPDDDVWYQFTANANTNYNVTVTPAGASPINDIVLNSRIGPACNGTSVSCIDNSTGANPEVVNITNNTAAPVVYYIRIYGFFIGGGTFDVCIQELALATNDECSTADIIIPNTDLNCGTVTAGTIFGATDSGVNPTTACTAFGTSNDDVWYEFVATSTTHQIDLLNVAPFTDMYHVLLEDNPCGGSPVAITCSDANSSTTNGLTIGNTYYIQVYSNFNNSYTTTFNICVGSPPPPPSNDLCSAPTLLCGKTISGTTVDTSNIAHGTGCGMSNYGVWYTFTGDGNDATVTTGGTFDHKLSISTGSCGSLTNIACIDGSGSFPADETFTISPTIAGTEYYVYIAHWQAGNNITGNFTITIDRSRTWNGSVNSDWNTAANWTPIGVPTEGSGVIIPNTATDPIIDGVTNANACSCTINSNGDLTIQANGTLTVENIVEIDPNGSFAIEDSASLIQVNEGTNIGNITMNRNANIKRLDYVYWSSPVANFPITSISPGTPSNVIWDWSPTVVRPPGPPPGNVPNTYGDWFNTTENMINGKGYIVRGPDAFTTTAQNYTATFVGVPNNGTISKTINRGSYIGADYTGPGDTMVTSDDDNWNLIGNPYPSAIDVYSFLTENTNIDGVVYLWTHASDPSAANADPFYEDFGYNYNSSDYLSHNGTGSTPPGFNGRIASGQSFFVLMNESTLSQTEAVEFNNTMRDENYDNSQFFSPPPNENNTVFDTDPGRIWLDLVGPSEMVNRILVGYVEHATMEKDRLYDARLLPNNSQSFYSLIDDDRLVIQGRQLPFNEEDQVPLGVVLPQSGNYTLAINTLDGLFEDDSQHIYIEDTFLGIISDLRANPYNFTSEEGELTDRFILRYTNDSLGNNNFTNESELTISTPNYNTIDITSKTSALDSVIIYDITGRVIFNKTDINTLHFKTDENVISNGIYIVKAILLNGKEKTQKIILK